jgi:hypothetical protein
MNSRDKNAGRTPTVSAKMELPKAMARSIKTGAL